MASQKTQYDDVKTNWMCDVVTENYSKLSDEFAKSQQEYVQAISGLQQEYLELMKVTVKTAISVQKEYFSNPNSRYQIPNTGTTQMENMINHSDKYTRNLINLMNIQNQLMAKNRSSKGICKEL
jgi:hypothetical protein